MRPDPHLGRAELDALDADPGQVRQQDLQEVIVAPAAMYTVDDCLVLPPVRERVCGMPAGCQQVRVSTLDSGPSRNASGDAGEHRVELCLPARTPAAPACAVDSPVLGRVGEQGSAEAGGRRMVTSERLTSVTSYRNDSGASSHGVFRFKDS
jgi:hypothetical protein